MRNHPFVDGNKRTSLLALYTFLGVNGFDFDVPEADAAAVILGIWAIVYFGVHLPGGSGTTRYAVVMMPIVLGLAAFAALTFWKWRLNVVVVVLAGGALGLLRAFAPGLFGGALS